MQVVINIENGLYEWVHRQLDVDEGCSMVQDAIMSGTPLPKGHGRIGDLDALETEMSNGIKAGLMIEGYENYSNINNVDDCLECVKYADTIIEADVPKR